MRTHLLAFSFFTCAACIAVPAVAQEATAEASAGGRMPNANQYMCQFDSTVRKGSLGTEIGKAVGPEMGQVLFVYQNAFRGFAVRLPAAPGSPSGFARLQRHNAKIARCVRDGIVHADGRPGGGGSGSGQTTPWGVARVGGPGDGTATSHRAFVVDSGIDLTHPDLNVDLNGAYDFINNNTTPQDGFGHGTHVAGIIGAKNNSIGVVGVAAGAPVVPIRVLDNTGYGADSGVTAAIDYLAGGIAAPGDVINLSLEADSLNPLMEQAITTIAAQGVRVVIAAGNNSANASNYDPGRVNALNVYTVSSFGSRDVFSRFSNYGNPPIDYAEPGENIISTYLNGGYATLSGTSMAAPHLSGILLLEATPHSGGTVSRDPDGHPDTIGVR